jgi:hypothetical protein
MALGFIVSPLGQEVAGQFPSTVNYLGTGAPYLCPPDAQFNQRGEQGYFYDSYLGGARGLGDGGIPTDTEMASVYGYTPVMGGWIDAKEGYFPGPWNPPGGWNAAGGYGPQPSLSGASGSTPTWLYFLVIAGLGIAGWWSYRQFKKPLES